MLTKLDLAKKVVTFVVGSGTSTIVMGIAVRNTNPEKVYQKVAVVSAAVVLGSMLADKAETYTDEKIDEIAAWYNENVKPAFQK